MNKEQEVAQELAKVFNEIRCTKCKNVIDLQSIELDAFPKDSTVTCKCSNNWFEKDELRWPFQIGRE